LSECIHFIRATFCSWKARRTIGIFPSGALLAFCGIEKNARAIVQGGRSSVVAGIYFSAPPLASIPRLVAITIRLITIGYIRTIVETINDSIRVIISG
jgi:hypothetical protein